MGESVDARNEGFTCTGTSYIRYAASCKVSLAVQFCMQLGIGLLPSQIAMQHGNTRACIRRCCSKR